MSLCLGCIIGERLENGVGRDILEESFFFTELEVLVHCCFHDLQWLHQGLLDFLGYNLGGQPLIKLILPIWNVLVQDMRNSCFLAEWSLLCETLIARFLQNQRWEWVGNLIAWLFVKSRCFEFMHVYYVLKVIVIWCAPRKRNCFSQFRWDTFYFMKAWVVWRTPWQAFGWNSPKLIQIRVFAIITQILFHSCTSLNRIRSWRLWSLLFTLV
jgi:hypothetical protein